MNLKKEFIMKSLEPHCTFTELCAEFGVSTKTGYKWKERFMQFGLHGLEDQPRRPRTSPNQVSEDVIFAILKLKQKKMSWGSPKIHKIYYDSHPESEYISRATVDRILKKAGLVEKKKRRRKIHPERLQIRVKPEQPNVLTQKCYRCVDIVPILFFLNLCFNRMILLGINNYQMNKKNISNYFSLHPL